MTIAPDRPRHGQLPVLDSGRDLLQHCRFSCNFDCFHAAPNAPSPGETAAGGTFAAIAERAISRRAVLQGSLITLGAAAATALRPAGAVAQSPSPDMSSAPSSSGVGNGSAASLDGLTFEPITLPDRTADGVLVAPGYQAAVLAAWGEPLFSAAPAFDVMAQTAAAQEQQFGYNCDYIAFLADDPAKPGAGLLWVNHEYTNPELMFPGWTAETTTAEIAAVEIAAHGGSIVEASRNADGSWSIAKDGRNRRITGTTPMVISGPAAGNTWLQTSADPTGTQVAGTLNNCSGGWTPWGTILTAEENFHQYFGNVSRLPEGPVRIAHERLGVTAEASERRWEAFIDRFDVTKEPNEPFRFGWIVEIDPRDPTSTPVKRTALGRFKHESASTYIARDGRIVSYSGDDERFEYVYKFVSSKPWKPGTPGGDILDEGTLYVARFNDDGSGAWLPLVFGEGPLTSTNGFRDQGDVLINTRLAADLLEPTKMDRPEDIARNPQTGALYLTMTNNVRRGVGPNYGIDAANPRAENRYGHIIELVEDGDDLAATTFRWDFLLICGDPSDQTTYFGGQDAANIVSPIANPDNVEFDGLGNLWISTDGQPGTIERSDAVFAVATDGDNRGAVKPFLSVPAGAEAAALFFAPDFNSLFVSVQHPGEGGTFEAPISRWPDLDPASPPRPAVVVAWRTAEGEPRIGA